MANMFIIMGRLTGRALSSHVIDRAISTATTYIVSEVRLADIKLKRTILRRKRTRHLTILGRTVYRLTLHDIDPSVDERVLRISRVLVEIDREIEIAEQELALRMEQERRKRNPHCDEKTSSQA
ncbi:hypothetical protein LLG96_12810 [bacterium]|nr:hypothetical protein [bacterium]